MSPHPLVVVEWLDACSHYSAMPLSQAVALPLAFRHTAGYLLHHDEERLVIAATFDPPPNPNEEPGYADITVIPTGWVKAIQETVMSKRRTPIAKERTAAIADTVKAAKPTKKKKRR